MYYGTLQKHNRNGVLLHCLCRVVATDTAMAVPRFDRATNKFEHILIPLIALTL